ncbi:MAG TPA: DUF6580 family putative transport protein [bacterium]|nr:DUF6580 family putative transport protein [bacterium]
MKVESREVTWFGVLPYALIAAGALLRVVPHPWNFAPIGALALFGGAVLPGLLGLAVPLAALALSDAVLGFYPGIAWVYGSYVLIALLGRALGKRRTVARVVTYSLAASILFYLVTNFGEWRGPLYPHTLAGLWSSYAAAVPFFRNTVLSDLCYSLAMFGIYAHATRIEEQRAGRMAPASQRTT